MRTEPLFTNGPHDVFFNRGVASSQAYERRFGNKRPDELKPASKRQEALDWLSRDLDNALLKFIANAKAGDALLCCFYEFRYEPVAAALKKAIGSGVDVQLIIDAKVNEHTDSKGKFHESFPRVENRKAITEGRHPRGARPPARGEAQRHPAQQVHGAAQGRGAHARGGVDGVDQHLDGRHSRPDERGPLGARRRRRGTVRRPTGSCSRETPAARPGTARPRSARRTTISRRRSRRCASCRRSWRTSRRAPRRSSARGAAGASSISISSWSTRPSELACITLAFGINKDFKARLTDNTPDNAIAFFLLEKKDKPTKANQNTFVFIGAKQNIYKAWGSFLREPLHQWAKETSAMGLGLNQHVSFIHSKFLLRDPLGADPVVITGSANFSEASTNDNDENMLAIRGDRRVADIYFTEFNRLFNHYYFRSVVESLKDRDAAANMDASLFLAEKDQWLEKYKPGSLRAKRVAMFRDMAVS